MTQKIETNVIKPEVSFMENEIEQLILTSENESALDSKIQEINDYMNNNHGKGKTSEEKDELYKNSQILWQELAVVLRDAKYNFHLNRKQYRFLTDLILKTLEYDVNSVFFAIELTELLGGMKGAKYSNDDDLVAFPVNATEITYIYHLISEHKVKGLTNNAYYFAQVLRRIGTISKVFNYYDATAKNLSTTIQDWVVSFEDGVSAPTKDIESEVVESEQNN
jgi:uncharacterized protein YjaG (DUF416 family)